MHLAAQPACASNDYMQKININNLAEYSWSSHKGKFAGFGKGISEALGRDPMSTDLVKRHPLTWKS